MMKLERLRIDKFRNVKPGSEIRFADGFNIVLGRNGTGKTTLLDLISRVVRWDFSDLEHEEFIVEFILRSHDSRIEASLSNVHRDRTNVESTVVRTLDSNRERFAAEMRVNVLTAEKVKVYEFVNGEMLIDGEVQDNTGVVSIIESLLYLAEVFYHAGFIFARALPNRARFDESLELFRAAWNAGGFPGTLSIWRALSTIGTTSIPLGMHAKLRERILTEPGFADFTISGEGIEFLPKVCQLMGFIRSELRIDVLDRISSKEITKIKLGNMIARFFFADGGFITQDRLSYGQKRLLMFYYYLAVNPDIVIADELVNGLHHQWITACIDEIGERQAFLTSQNPLLLDYLPFSSAEHVRKSFVLCTSELDENQKPIWSWSNMSEEASHEFYSAYEVGIEHVSEILQSQGLF